MFFIIPIRFCGNPLKRISPAKWRAGLPGRRSPPISAGRHTAMQIIFSKPYYMKNFKEMGIKVAARAFVGDSIKMDRILNRPITVHHYKITDSNKKMGTECLHLQITVDGQLRVLFTGATALLEAIRQVPAEDFPFLTTIIKQNERSEFT
jgi:hypothetical protein